jgi:CubicO group peptidase (beta-lactamase class C family)
VLAFSLCPADVAWATEEALTREVDGLTFDQFVQVALRDYGVPGATVVIANANANETVFLKGYGIRSSDAAGAVDENTRFQLASMSKFIAATAVGALVDRGAAGLQPRPNCSPASRRWNGTAICISRWKSVWAYWG